IDRGKPWRSPDDSVATSSASMGPRSSTAESDESQRLYLAAVRRFNGAAVIDRGKLASEPKPAPLVGFASMGPRSSTAESLTIEIDAEFGDLLQWGRGHRPRKAAPRWIRIVVFTLCF